MKYKILLLSLLVFVLCGCTVNYNLSIDENSYYYEKTIITSTGNENYSKDYLYSLYLEEYPIYESEEYLYYDPTNRVEGNTYYEKSIEDNNFGYIATYNAKYDNDSYKDSRMLNTAFGECNIGYDPEGEYYYLELEKLNIFNAENYINNIIVNITVSNNFVVLKNNATSINGNVYTWMFDNVDNELILKYQKQSVYNRNKTNNNEQEEPRETKKEDEKSNNITVVLIALAAIVGYLIFIIIIISSKKNKK